jgi:hypothetical protein
MTAYFWQIYHNLFVFYRSKNSEFSLNYFRFWPFSLYLPGFAQNGKRIEKIKTKLQ